MSIFLLELPRATFQLIELVGNFQPLNWRAWKWLMTDSEKNAFIMTEKGWPLDFEMSLKYIFDCAWVSWSFPDIEFSCIQIIVSNIFTWWFVRQRSTLFLTVHSRMQKNSLPIIWRIHKNSLSRYETNIYFPEYVVSFSHVSMRNKRIQFILRSCDEIINHSIVFSFNNFEFENEFSHNWIMVVFILSHITSWLAKLYFNWICSYLLFLLLFILLLLKVNKEHLNYLQYT